VRVPAGIRTLTVPPSMVGTSIVGTERGLGEGDRHRELEVAAVHAEHGCGSTRQVT
jgi:hypothetical protein